MAFPGNHSWQVTEPESGPGVQAPHWWVEAEQRSKTTRAVQRLNAQCPPWSPGEKPHAMRPSERLPQLGCVRRLSTQPPGSIYPPQALRLLPGCEDSRAAALPVGGVASVWQSCSLVLPRVWLQCSLHRAGQQLWAWAWPGSLPGEAHVNYTQVVSLRSHLGVMSSLFESGSV